VTFGHLPRIRFFERILFLKPFMEVDAPSNNFFFLNSARFDANGANFCQEGHKP